MSTRGLFPHVLDGVAMRLPAIVAATGLTKYDITLALQRDPSIATVGALKAAVVARKSRPARPRHLPSHSSLLWNGGDRPRKGRDR